MKLYEVVVTVINETGASVVRMDTKVPAYSRDEALVRATLQEGVLLNPSGTVPTEGDIRVFIREFETESEG